jgi:hypothetical protein
MGVYGPRRLHSSYAPDESSTSGASGCSAKSAFFSETEFYSPGKDGNLLHLNFKEKETQTISKRITEFIGENGVMTILV